VLALEYTIEGEIYRKKDYCLPYMREEVMVNVKTRKMQREGLKREIEERKLILHP
jgi:hypothetical protein